MSDVYKNDELYPLLGEPIAPIVMTIPALRITTKKEEYLFYGNRIQIEDMNAAYGYLRQQMNLLKLEHAEEKSNKQLKMPQIAKKLMPAFGKKDKEDTTDDTQ